MKSQISQTISKKSNDDSMVYKMKRTLHAKKRFDKTNLF